MNKGLIVSCAAVAAAMMAFSGESLAQSSGPVSTETVEQWNTQLRDQIRQLEAEKDKVEQRQRQRRLQAEKENAELHERVRQLQSELSSMQSPNSQPSPLPQRPAAASNPQPERLPPTSGASTSSPQPQRAIRGTDRATRTRPGCGRAATRGADGAQAEPRTRDCGPRERESDRLRATESAVGRVP